MRITYSSSLEDHIAFTDWLAESQPGYRRSFWAMRLLTPLILLSPTIVIASTAPQDTASYPIAALAAALGIYIFATYPTKLKARRERCVRALYDGKKGQAIFCQHTLEIVNDTIKETTDFGNADLKISIINDIIETPTHVFIMLSGNGAYVIPRSKIEDGDVIAFAAALQKQRGA